MRKIFFAMIALLVALSCSEQGSTHNTPPPSGPAVAGPEFTANINEANLPTGENGCKVTFTWTEGDLFSVFYNSVGNVQYKYIGETGSTSGKIASVNESKDDLLPTCYAIYPYAEKNKMEDGVLYFSLPAEQTYKSGGLDAEANVLVAKCSEEDNNTFEFKSVFGYICLHLYGSAEISSITLKGNNNEVLAGDALFDMTSNEIFMLNENDGTVVTLKCNEAVTTGLTETTAAEFWLALPAVSFDKGFTVTITDSEGNSLEKIFNNNTTVNSGDVLTKTILFDGDLSCEDAKSLAASMSEDWIASTREVYASAIADNVFRYNGLKLKIFAQTYGEKPADGRSLYISMHGGGGTDPGTNDGQWDNQKGLYQPEEGVYVAPRAPWNEWNMWFKAGLDELFEQLIQAAVATWDVNPDKVYLMGYSAGGDGAYKMAPRMADRWAAASMMAGHPNGASMLSLRNTPFSIWVGANDSSYNRNTVAAEYGKILDDLQAADPDGYIHSTHIVAGKGHWMDNEDRAAVPWMAQFKRNPYPNKIVWRQAEVKRTSFYWLSIDPEEYKNEATIIAEIDGNTINVSKCDYKYVYFHLNDKMVDLDKPVVIIFNDSEVFNGMLKRSRANMESSLEARGDIRYIFPAVVKVKMANNGALENPDNGDNIEW
jgi:hypothetical protein